MVYPLGGRSGTNNAIDIDQINVNSIERIEIVEGPMAVNYGADALAGVINIITRKELPGKFNLRLSLHEETIGRTYGWFEEGIHSPSLQVAYQFHPNGYAQAETRINHFGGWTGTGNGRDKSWYPKTQYFTGGMIRFDKDRINLYYRLDHLHELIENLGPVQDNNPCATPLPWMRSIKAPAGCTSCRPKCSLGE
ncbi:MAG: TonB-dependent receptor plug domain-containing protein, partial [Bacteroidia bacterium]|nr:TonB-dependent receptor plug domain-containing protein [Bacteroidia bacterium]